MTDEDATHLVYLLLCAFAGFMIGSVAGSCIEQQKVQKEAIKRGDGRYNPTTGIFEWVKEPVNCK